MSSDEKPVESLSLINPEQPVSPIVENGVEAYNSSEEFQRAHRKGLEEKAIKEVEQEAFTEKEKIRKALDKFIEKYSKTTEVRKMAKANKKSADHQLDVAADVVEILEKVKNTLR